MPSGIFVRSEEHKRHISEALTGKRHSSAHIDNFRKTQVGKKAPWVTENNKAHFNGSGNPNWKGGITRETVRVRNSFPSFVWRNAVRERDNWTCKRCGGKEHIHAHHIRNFFNYPDLRFDIGNGISLCKTCHLLFHKEYGQRKNTVEQMCNFIGDICG
jgi:hypothetical protein